MPNIDPIWIVIVSTAAAIMFLLFWPVDDNDGFPKGPGTPPGGSA